MEILYENGFWMQMDKRAEVIETFGWWTTHFHIQWLPQSNPQDVNYSWNWRMVLYNHYLPWHNTRACMGSKRHQYMEKYPTRKSAWRVSKQQYVHMYLCISVFVCVWIPTVRLRPTAERGSANIQTLNTLRCTTAAAAAAAGLRSSVKEARTQTLAPCVSCSWTHE